MKITNSPNNITHVLNRLSFGPVPGDRTQVQREGISAYISRQLNFNSADELAAIASNMTALPNLKRSPVELFDQYAAPKKATDAQRMAANRRQTEVLKEAERARLLLAIGSASQLQEVMVDFWFNHFNVFAGKGPIKMWVGAYEHQAIRPFALGKFRDLLKATAKHPAMLFYLDNWRNTDPNSVHARGAFRGLNENYARELLELHTLGANAGYRQADVESLARILTGWSSVNYNQPGRDESGFLFVRGRHDASDKVLLGEAIAGGGVEEGERALDLLAAHPSTARHISYKLAQYFVADVPSPTLVEHLAGVFSTSEGDIKAVLLALFEHPEFWTTANYQSKFKTPYQYLLSAVRAIGLTVLPGEMLNRLSGGIVQLGMPIYRCRTPNGYAQTKDPWLTSDAMLRRVNLAIATVNFQGEDRTPPPALLAQTLETLGDQLSTNTRQVIESAPPYMRVGLLLGSPEMMYR